MDQQIRVSRRSLVIAVVTAGVLLIAAALLLIPGARDHIATVIDGRTVASPAVLAEQREGTERSIGRAYVKALGQLRTVRGLTLPITPAEADRVVERSIAELRVLRREALTALAAAYALPAGEAAAYIEAAEVRLEQIGADPTPVLLAPRLYAIVSRTNQVAQQIADRATEDMTRAPGAPSPSPSPGVRPTPSPSPGR